MKAKDYQEQIILGWKEQQLQNFVINTATALGWMHFHVYDSRRSPAGFPDLVLMRPDRGQLLVRELKSQRGRYRPGQKEWLGGFTAAGVDAGTWRPADVVSGRIERELRSGCSAQG